MALKERITCLDVARDLGLEPDDDLMWSVGAAVREQWLSLYPEMSYELREKKSGAGSHQMATYPTWFRETIENEIRRRAFERDRQLALFPGD